jgi:hypothetical protein
MIRKAIIAILSFVAVSLFVVYMARVDHVYWMEWGSRYTDREAWGFSLIRGGLGIWYNSPNPEQTYYERNFNTRGFRLNILEHYEGYRYCYARIPLWLPAALAAVYPVLTFIRGPLRRRRRRRKGLCPNCGYNLTGLPEPRCPECGKQIERPVTAPTAGGPPSQNLV